MVKLPLQMFSLGWTTCSSLSSVHPGLSFSTRFFFRVFLETWLQLAVVRLLEQQEPCTGEISNLVRHHKNIELPVKHFVNNVLQPVVNSHSLLGPPGGVAGDALGNDGLDMGDILEQRKKMYSEMRELLRTGYSSRHVVKLKYTGSRAIR